MMKISKKSAKMIVKSAKTVKKEQKSIFPSQVRKRNGTIVDFDISRIEAAIGKAMRAAGEYAEGAPEGVAAAVAAALVSGHAGEKSHIPSVEETQARGEREPQPQGPVAPPKTYPPLRGPRRGGPPGEGGNPGKGPRPGRRE